MILSTSSTQMHVMVNIFRITTNDLTDLAALCERVTERCSMTYVDRWGSCRSRIRIGCSSCPRSWADTGTAHRPPDTHGPPCRCSNSHRACTSGSHSNQHYTCSAKNMCYHETTTLVEMNTSHQKQYVTYTNSVNYL